MDSSEEALPWRTESVSIRAVSPSVAHPELIKSKLLETSSALPTLSEPLHGNGRPVRESGLDRRGRAQLVPRGRAGLPAPGHFISSLSESDLLQRTSHSKLVGRRLAGAVVAASSAFEPSATLSKTKGCGLFGGRDLKRVRSCSSSISCRYCRQSWVSQARWTLLLYGAPYQGGKPLCLLELPVQDTWEKVAVIRRGLCAKGVHRGFKENVESTPARSTGTERMERREALSLSCFSCAEADISR